MKLDARLTLFITLVSTFMVCLVVGDLIGGKVTSFHLFGREWPFSAGQLAFPVTFILTDILNEFYGRSIVRRITLLAFIMVGLTFLIVYAAGAMPWAEMTRGGTWDGITPREFDLVFTQATQIQLSSMAAFLVANFVDISVFSILKRATGNRMLWLRATGSTAISQLIDTIVISALVWGRKLTFEQYVSVVMTSYLIKLAVAIVITPLLYVLHSVIEKGFGIAPTPLDDKAAS
ncbi:MAG: queuosine precursor transporter [Deltaproteobacteria bacterium]|nr:queuosine precursor transporter [Deltaproteobacteria bacterium]